MDARTNEKRLSFALFSILLLCYSYVNGGWGYNQYTRLDLLHAVVLHGTFTIDEHQGNTGDKARFNDHYYSDKAPGIAFVALPAFTLTSVVLHASGVNLESGSAFVISHWATSAGSVGLIAALGGLALFALLSRYVGQRIALLSVLATYLGSLPFPYSTMLFSHGAIIGFLSIALWAILGREHPSGSFWESCRKKNIAVFLMLAASLAGAGLTFLALSLLGVARLNMLVVSAFSVGGAFLLCSLAFHALLWWQRKTPSQPTFLLDALAGLCSGLAIASEYTAAPAVAGIFILLLVRGYRRALVFSVFALLPTLLIPLYSLICFGELFSTGYNHLRGFFGTGMNRGFFGIGFPPHLSIIVSLLIAPSRGLFFWTPFFLLGIVGLVPLFKKERSLSIVIVVLFLGYVLSIAGYRYWDGGTALGPRHLSSLIPFLAIASAAGFLYLPVIGNMLVAASLALMGLATVVTPLIGRYDNPVTQFYLPRLLKGQFEQNLGMALGLRGWWSFMPLAILLSFPAFLIATSEKFSRRLSANDRPAQAAPAEPSRLNAPSLFRPALTLAILFGILLRIADMGTMEFKGDEISFLSLGYRAFHDFGSITSLPITSLSSLKLPPLFAYVIGLPLLLTTNPLAVAFFIALLNAAGVVLLYFFLRSHFGRDIALQAAALFATAPWAIVLSRKIWNPDLIVPFLVLFYFLLFKALKSPRTSTVIAAAAAFGVASQMHLSVWFLVPALLLFLLILRARLKTKHVLAGGAAFLLLYVPYLIFLFQTSFKSVGGILSAGSSTFPKLSSLLLWTASVGSGLKFKYLLGDTGLSQFLEWYGPALAQYFFFAFAFLSLAAIAFFTFDIARKTAAFLRGGKSLSAQEKILLLLLLVFFCVLGSYLLFKAQPVPHYFLVFAPLPAVAFTLLLERLNLRWPSRTLSFASQTLVLLIVLANLLFVSSFYRFIEKYPKSIKGDYGTPYDLQNEKDHLLIESRLKGTDTSP